MLNQEGVMILIRRSFPTLFKLCMSLVRSSFIIYHYRASFIRAQ